MKDVPIDQCLNKIKLTIIEKFKKINFDYAKHGYNESSSNSETLELSEYLRFINISDIEIKKNSISIYASDIKLDEIKELKKGQPMNISIITKKLYSFDFSYYFRNKEEKYIQFLNIHNNKKLYNQLYFSLEINKKSVYLMIKKIIFLIKEYFQKTANLNDNPHLQKIIDGSYNYNLKKYNK